jgi:hypothetical protein
MVLYQICVFGADLKSNMAARVHNVFSLAEILIIFGELKKCLRASQDIYQSWNSNVLTFMSLSKSIQIKNCIKIRRKIEVLHIPSKYVLNN